MAKTLEPCPFCGQLIYGRWTQCPYCRMPPRPEESRGHGCLRALLTFIASLAAIVFTIGGVGLLLDAGKKLDWIRVEGTVTDWVGHSCGIVSTESGYVVIYDRRDGLSVRSIFCGVDAGKGDVMDVWYDPATPPDRLIAQEYTTGLSGIPHPWTGVNMGKSPWQTLHRPELLDVALWFTAAAGAIYVFYVLNRKPRRTVGPTAGANINGRSRRVLGSIVFWLYGLLALLGAGGIIHRVTQDTFDPATNDLRLVVQTVVAFGIASFGYVLRTKANT